MNVGRQIKRLREERGWSQEQLAIQARRFSPTHGLARETISRIENGHRPPDMWVVEACASALGVTPDVLLSEDAPLGSATPQPAPVRSSTQLVINEAQPAYTPLAREVAQLAARLNRLDAPRRARLLHIFNQVLEVATSEDEEEADPELQQLLRTWRSLPVANRERLGDLLRAEAAALALGETRATKTDAAQEAAA